MRNMARAAALMAGVVLWGGCGQEGETVTGATGAGTGGDDTSGTGASSTGASSAGGGGAGASGGGGQTTGATTGATTTSTGPGTTTTGSGGSAGENCVNGVDDDGDTAEDCDDTECTMAPVCGNLLLNEIDYDQTGSDDAEYVEVFNAGASTVDLAGVSVELINGNGNTSYDSIALSGTLPPGGYLVVADAGVPVDAGAVVFTRGSMSIQQGPDAVALYDSTYKVVLDGVCYGGELGMVTIDGAMFTLTEGTATSAEDAASGDRAIARSPNGQDTGNDANDWVAVTTLTPGAANP